MSILDIFRSKASEPSATSKELDEQIEKAEALQAENVKLQASAEADYRAALLDKSNDEVAAIEQRMATLRLDARRLAAVIAQLEERKAEAERRELDDKVKGLNAVRRDAWQRMKLADMALHKALLKAVDCLRDLEKAGGEFGGANAFCAQHGLDALPMPRDILQRLIQVEGEANGTFARMSVPLSLPGYWPPPGGPPHYRASDLSRMHEISLPR